QSRGGHFLHDFGIRPEVIDGNARRRKCGKAGRLYGAGISAAVDIIVTSAPVGTCVFGISANTASFAHNPDSDVNRLRRSARGVLLRSEPEARFSGFGGRGQKTDGANEKRISRFAGGRFDEWRAGVGARLSARLSARRLSARRLSARRLSARRLSARRLSARRLSARRLSARRLSARRL